MDTNKQKMKKRFMKFIGNCQVTKVFKKGSKPKIFLKCIGNSKTKSMTAQQIINES